MNCADIVELSPLYLSGELDTARTAAFSTHLKTCSTCAQEIERQAEFDARLRAGILAEGVDSAALDGRIRKDIGAGWTRRWLVAAASVLLAAFLGYRVFVNAGTPQACADAARDHRMEVVDGQPRPWLTDQAAIEALAQGRGVSASVVGALAASGYRLERGKLCRLDGRAFLHLIYTNGAGEVSVFLRQKDAVDGRGAYDVGNEHVAAFQTDRLTAIVVTDQSRDAALQFGRFAASVL